MCISWKSYTQCTMGSSAKPRSWGIVENFCVKSNVTVCKVTPLVPVLMSILSYWQHHVVCLSVCDTVHSGSQGWCTRLKVVPACSYQACSYICRFRHFCCRMYRLATKCTETNKSKKTRAWVFFSSFKEWAHAMARRLSSVCVSVCVSVNFFAGIATIMPKMAARLH